MTYAPFIGWALFAGVAAVPLWKLLSEYLPGIPETSGWSLTPEEGKALVKYGGVSLMVAFVGGAVVSLGGGGPSAKGIPTPAGDPPAAPTADAYVPNDSQAIFVTSAYSGEGSHSSTIVHVDTLDGDWSTLDYADTVDSGDLTRDTTTGMVSGQRLKARIKHVDENGESDWSDSVVFVTPDWASSWDHATGSTDDAMLDGASGSRNFDGCMGGGGCQKDSVGLIIDPGTDLGGWPTAHAYMTQYLEQNDDAGGPNVGSLMIYAEKRWPNLGPVGDTLWYRQVFRANASDGFPSNNAHHLHSGNRTAGEPRISNNYWNGASAGEITFSVANVTDGIVQYRVDVETFHTYTLIVGLERTAADSMWFAVANVYDSTGTLAFTASDFTNAGSWGNLTNTTAAQIHLALGDSAWQSIELGNNDPGEDNGEYTAVDSSKVYYTCLAVSLEGNPGLCAPPGGN